MSKFNRIFLIVSFFLFFLLVGLAVYHESTYYLYTASAIPLIIVPLLPDIKSNQYIKKGKTYKDVWLTRKPDGDGENAGHVVLGFEPGFVAWHKKYLFFHVDDIPAAAAPSASAAVRDMNVSLPVLAFDLIPHPRKSGWIGISLDHLAQRTKALSYTIEDVNRLVINASDVEAIVRRPSSSAAAQQNRGVQA